MFPTQIMVSYKIKFERSEEMSRYVRVISENVVKLCASKQEKEKKDQ